MRRLINSTYITLDGAVEDLHLWHSLGGQAAEHLDIQNDLLQACDVVLMGRRTYEVLRPRGRHVPATPFLVV
jgi:dihydrofolate reductase